MYPAGYAEVVAQHTLKKFMMLVYFLDKAKQSRLIEHNPCLFCKDSDFKVRILPIIVYLNDIYSDRRKGKETDICCKVSFDSSFLNLI